LVEVDKHMYTYTAEQILMFHCHARIKV